MGSDVCTVVVVGEIEGQGGIEVIGIVVRMGDVLVSADGELIDGGRVMRLRSYSWIIESKISEVGAQEDVRDVTFIIGSKVGGSKVWVVSSSSSCWTLVACTSEDEAFAFLFPPFF